MPTELDEDALYEMSDDELEQAFKDAKAGLAEVDEVPIKEDETEVETEESTVDTELDAEEENELDTDEEVDEVKEDIDESEQPNIEDSEEGDNQPEEEETEAEEESTDTPDEENVDTREPEKEESKPEVKKRVYKANGQDYEFTEEEALDQFGKVFAQAANYTQKMQAIAEGRKTLSKLKDNDMSDDDIDLMIDVLKGNKEAITQVVKRAGIDTLDIDTEKESQYTPNVYGKTDQELDLDDVISNIEKDQEFAITQHVVDKQWDSESKKALAKNPEWIEGLHSDIKTGIYDKVNPIAMKMRVLGGGTKSDLEYYVEAGTQYYKQLKLDAENQQAQEQAAISKQAEIEARNQEQIQAVKAQKEKNKITKQAAGKRKAAAPSKKAAGKKDVVDYLDDSDEAFDQWEKEYRKKYG